MIGGSDSITKSISSLVLYFERLKRIVPTAKAEEMRPKILEHIQKTEARLIEGIAPEDVLICKKALGQMLCNLSEMNKEENQKDE